MRDLRHLLAHSIAPPSGRAWHGGATPVGAVRGVSAKLAAWVPAPGRPSIWSLALHLAYWNYAVRRHLEPGKVPRFPRSPSNWPAPPRVPDEAEWRRDRQLLAEEHRRLAAAIIGFDPARYNRRPPGGKRWTYGELIAGTLAHDAYHAGQIQLLKRLGRR